MKELKKILLSWVRFVCATSVVCAGFAYLIDYPPLQGAVVGIQAGLGFLALMCVVAFLEWFLFSKDDYFDNF